MVALAVGAVACVTDLWWHTLSLQGFRQTLSEGAGSAASPGREPGWSCEQYNQSHSVQNLKTRQPFYYDDYLRFPWHSELG